MEAAVNRTILPYDPLVRFETEPPFRPEESRLSIAGIVTDDGSACTHHLSSLTALGSMLTGERSAEATKQTMLERAERMKERMAQVTGGDPEDLSEEDLANMPVEQRRRLGAILNEMPEAMMAADTDGQDVVIEVFSPNAWWWEYGVLSPNPALLEHGGIGGWQSNSAAAVVLQLPGTAPADLREGGRYEAIAFAPTGEGVDRDDLDQVPTVGGFYAFWEGEFQPTVRGGMAFEGVIRYVSGRLSGTATVEDITGAEVTGAFSVDGPATLHVERSVFRRNDDGQIVGDESKQSTRQGTVTVSGSFSAPTTHAGWQRAPTVGYQSVTLDE